jgi:hypothetical protein
MDVPAITRPDECMEDAQFGRRRGRHGLVRAISKVLPERMVLCALRYAFRYERMGV